MPQTTHTRSFAIGASAIGQLRELTLRNFLSFGPDTPSIPLRRLNVLIGPNGSGKSNLIEAVSLLRSCPTDVKRPFRDGGGGVAEWIYKGAYGESATIEAVVEVASPIPLRHRVQFSAINQAFHLEDEVVESEYPNRGQSQPSVYYRYDGGSPVLRIHEQDRPLRRESIDSSLSILAQRKDPESYPQLTALGEAYSDVRIYRDWQFGRESALRVPQPADLRTDRLEEDFSNLGLFLNRLRRNPPAKHRVITGLRDLYETFDDFDVTVEGNTVQVFFTEGNYTVPAPRLSDGTLRYLCLLAILCDPDPPGIVCVEEPELGLHPDMMPKVADLLLEAAERTQLIVTTHSDILIDSLSASPEAVLVCENHGATTLIERLDSAALAPWLQEYRLGQLWNRGDLGGNRW